jgi:hypothetical protein
VVIKENMMIKSLLAAMLVASTWSAFAASGGSPNGKPFVEINGQIAEVQGQIATLEERMDNIFARVEKMGDRLSSAETGISLLVQENNFLRENVESLNAGLTSMEEIIGQLKAQTFSMQAELDEYGDRTGLLALEVESNQMLIGSLEASLGDEIAGLHSMIGLNAEAIAILSDAQRSLEGQLELKQKILNQTCDDGYEVRGYEAGTLVCDKIVSKGGGIELTQVMFYRELGYRYQTWIQDVNPWFMEKKYNGYWEETKAANSLKPRCPNGSSVMGGGVAEYPEYFIGIRSSYGVNSNDYDRRDGWNVEIEPLNTKYGQRTFYGYRNNPLWIPYLVYLRQEGPAETLFVSAFALCASATPNEPID